ncbi:MAG: sulfatase family protein [Planctomycetota bacterium]|jgi:arylsulfatase A-like enzyme
MLTITSTASAAEKPNILFLMADDLGYGDVGFNGSKIIQTPHMDRMATEGLRLTRFYSVGPVCSPTRASCLTGRHYMRMGLLTVNIGCLPEQEVTTGHIALANGYTTGHFGKWHLGTMSKTESPVRSREHLANGYAPPWLRGYDVTFTTETNIATWDPLDYTDLRLPKHTCTFWSNGQKVPGDYRGSSERIIVDRAIDFIRGAAQRDQPFLANIWFYGPHSPVRAGKELRDLYPGLPLGQQHYNGAVTNIDIQVGRLRQALEELGVADNTLIIFTSDNGPEGPGQVTVDYTPYHGAYYGSAGEFRGRKRYLYNGGVCVPAFAWWPSTIQPGRVSDEPVCAMDFLPTLTDLLGAPLPANRPIDGASILPLLRGDNWNRRKPIPFASNMRKDSPDVAMIYGDYKYAGHWSKPEGGHELYHLQNDPAEQNDLSETNPELTRTMRKNMERWVESARHSYNGGDYDSPYSVQGRFVRIANPQSPGDPATQK